MPLLRANFGFDSRREHHTTADRDNFSVVFLCRNIVQRIKRSVLRIGYKVAVHFKRNRRIAVPHIFAYRLNWYVLR